MEDKEVLRYDGPGTETSGDPWFSEAGLQPFLIEGGFADSFSWGYRLVTVLTFNNAIGAVTLEPILAWAHDVEGVTPTPIRNFVAGTKAMSLMLNDFISLSSSYSF